MTNLLKKSTKTLTYTRHIPTSLPENKHSELTNIIKKYNLEFKIVSAHKLIDRASYIKPKNHIRIVFSSTEKLDWKLYSAMIELDLLLFNKSESQPFIGTRQQNLRQQYIDLREKIISEYQN